MPENGGHKYERGADIFAHAASKFDIAVSDHTIEEWRLILHGIYDLDQCLDSRKPTPIRMLEFDHLLGNITGSNAVDSTGFDYVHELRNRVTAWPTAQQEQFTEIMQEWKFLSTDKRYTQTARDLGTISIHEGKMCGNLFTAPEASKKQSLAFTQWLGNLIAGGTVIDAAFDLSQDYADGLVKVKPTRFNQLTLLSMGIPKIIRTLPRLDIKLFKNLADSTSALTQTAP